VTGLKITLFVAFLLTMVFALGYLFFPGQMADADMGPEDIVIARYGGVTMVGLALALWYASRNPHKNVAVVRAALVLFALTAIVGLYHGFTGEEEWGRALISIVVGGLFTLSLALFYPMGAKAT
jgi:peptidoglycan/LPS O-acetylase OafA/YrhL